MCNAKGVASNNEPTENDHPTVVPLIALWTFVASFSLIFWFYFLVHFLRFYQCCFQAHQTAFNGEKALITQ